MIGDDVRDDVLGAIKSDFMGCLVRTGKYSENDEKHSPDAVVFDSFPKAVTTWFA